MVWKVAGWSGKFLNRMKILDGVKFLDGVDSLWKSGFRKVQTFGVSGVGGGGIVGRGKSWSITFYSITIIECVRVQGTVPLIL